MCRILGGNNKATAFRIAERYFHKYDRRLVDDLNKELSGNLRRATTTWIQSQDPTRGDDEAEEVEVPEEKVPEEDIAAAAAAALEAPVVAHVIAEVPPPEIPVVSAEEEKGDEKRQQEEARR